MRDRLPAPYQRTLRARYAVFKGGELHRAVMNLAISYRKNYDITFPPLNTPTIVLQYLRELALPRQSTLRPRRPVLTYLTVETYAHAKEIMSLLRLNLAIPTGGRPPLDNPDTLLIASVVLTAKLLYPMDGRERLPTKDGNPACLKLDWEKWQDIFADQGEAKPARRDFDSLTSEDVASMSEKEMDEYLEWYRQARLVSKEGRQMGPEPHQHT